MSYNTVVSLASMDWRKHLRKALKDKGYTLATIGAERGVSESAAGHWFTGRRTPSIEDLRAMAKMAGMNLNDIFDEKSNYLIVDKSEMELVEALRTLPADHQIIAKNMVVGLASGIPVVRTGKK